MRAFLDRLSFDQLCIVTTAAAATAIGLIGGAINWWVYDQAGDQ